MTGPHAEKDRKVNEGHMRTTNHGAAQYVRSGDVVHREVADEHLLIPVRGALADMECVFALTPVAAHIWQRLDAPRTVAELARDVAQAFEVALETARRDTDGFLDTLRREGLVHVREAA